MPIPKLRAPVLALLCVTAIASPLLGQEPLEMLPDGKARARIGDLQLYHDPQEWRIDRDGDGFAVRCVGADCDDPLMSIAVVAADQSACSPGAVIDRSLPFFPDAWTRRATVASAIGLTVHVATLDQGCRNWAGSPVFACTRHYGNVYWFDAPGDGCHTSPRQTEALLRLLNGLSATGLTDRD